MKTKIINLINQIEKLKEKPLNIVSTVHPDENAHTRILFQLFNYKIRNYWVTDEYVILKKFIGELNKFLSDENQISDLDNASLKIKEQYYCSNKSIIDLLIYEKSKCAIIIENKINNAPDQEKQIERYVDQVKDAFKIPVDKVFVVYLTFDGTKNVSDESLTEKAKNDLGYKNKQENGRFIAMNYQDHILSYLKDLNENLSFFEEEKTLKNYIFCYLSFFEEIVEFNKNLSKKIASLINQEFSLSENSGLNDYERVINQLGQVLAEKKNCTQSTDGMYVDEIKKTILPYLEKQKQTLIYKEHPNTPESKAFFIRETFQDKTSPFKKVGLWKDTTVFFDYYDPLNSGRTKEDKFSLDVVITATEIKYVFFMRNKGYKKPSDIDVQAVDGLESLLISEGFSFNNINYQKIEKVQLDRQLIEESLNSLFKKLGGLCSVTP